MVLKCIILAAVLGLLPVLIGAGWTGRKDPDAGNLIKEYLYGLAIMLTVFELFAVPMSLKHMRLSNLTKIYTAVMAVLAVISVVRCRTFQAQRKWLAGLPAGFSVMLGVSVICILLQAGYVTQEQHIDEDDAFYVATATTSVAKDRLYSYSPYTGKKYKSVQIKLNMRYILSSWPVFLAMLSKLSGMHAAVIAHMILPAVTLMWLYLVYYLLAAWLFPDEKGKRGLFMFLLVCLLSFSGFSVYSAGVFAFVRGWQGKAVLAGSGIPFFLYGCLEAMEDPKWNKKWFSLFFAAGLCVTLTSMGTLLICLMAGCFGLYNAVKKKQAVYLVNSAAVCLPAIACAGMFLLVRLLVK